ncbi:hypothetical protein OPQ81_011129 [Rhizoctonia solani]|nr:hypothetical protein OPQ81_011129 [Rhizoctonia solani]
MVRMSLPDESIARSILEIPGMKQLLLQQMGLSPPQTGPPAPPADSSQIASTEDIPRECGCSRGCSPAKPKAPDSSSFMRATPQDRGSSPKRGSTGSKTPDSSRTRGNNTGHSLSPKPISKERKDKGKGKGKKRKCSLSPEEAREPDEYDLAYTSGVERIKYTVLEQLSTCEEKDQYVRKHGHPYSVRVGFDFNPYVKELAKDDFQRIARPKGELGCDFLPHVIAGLKTDYDSYMNYLGDLRKCVIKYEPPNADVGEGKITWSHYGGSV